MNQINSAEDINRKLEACPPRPYFVMKDDYLTKFIFDTGMRLKCCSIEIAPLRGRLALGYKTAFMRSFLRRDAFLCLFQT